MKTKIFSNRKIEKPCINLITGFLYSFFILFSNGCSDYSKKLTFNEKDLPGILNRGKIVMLAENTAASYFIYKGKKMGFEYEILNEFAKEIGVELEVKVVDDLNLMHSKLAKGEGDFIACNYTVTKNRKKDLVFSEPILKTPQVLIQRKKTKLDSTNKNFNLKTPYIHSVLDLAKKKIAVWEGSSYYQRLLNLQEEIGDTIYIQETHGHQSAEELIEMVAMGEIDYTVTEKNIAKINSRFYTNLDCSISISFDQKVAFGLSQNAPILTKKFNDWFRKFKKNEAFQYLSSKYFKTNENSQVFYAEEGQSIQKGSFSKFDQIIQRESSKKNIDWRFVAAIIQQESGFDPLAEGFGGAYGLMQFMPGTGPSYDVYPSSTPEEQIIGGARFISKLFSLMKSIVDQRERMKFVAAAYNSGPGHVLDARNLAKKNGLNPNVWNENVEIMMINLGKKEFYTDEIVTCGAFRGARTVGYVNSVLARFERFGGK
jgi:membrane-bound lytic murein transglycosylase F